VNPVYPFTSWETAATNIQDAVDAAWTGATILVSNGVYRVGTTGMDPLLANGLTRVALTKGVVVRSVNGPAVTILEGEAGDVRCAYVGEGCVLSGFTLTKGNLGGAWCEASGILTNCIVSGNSSSSAGAGVIGGILYNCTLTGNVSYDSGGGASGSILHDSSLTNNRAQYSGGGVSGGTLYNCMLAGNSAQVGSGGGADNSTLSNCILTGNAAQSVGGGASGSTLYNCVLTGNSAQDTGGGVSSSTLYNCNVTDNRAAHGGGTSDSSLYNCIVSFNQAQNGANYLNAIFEYSCTTPRPDGPGNIDTDPLLASVTHLLPGSLCIGAGKSAYASGVDIDGQPSLVNSSVTVRHLSC
jgi:hypothetical protein